MKQGATPDGDTILWWLKQSPEARAAICIDDTLSISDALSELNHFINRHADNTKYLKVWGNGATFDNVILRGLTSEQDKSARGRTGMTTMYARSLRLGVPSDSTPKWTCLSMANGNNAYGWCPSSGKICFRYLAEINSCHQHRIMIFPGAAGFDGEKLWTPCFYWWLNSIPQTFWTLSS